MGHPIIPPDPIIGDNCVLCEGIHYPVNETPEFIWINYRGVSPCALPIEAPGVASGWYRLGPNAGCGWGLFEIGWDTRYTAATFIVHNLMGIPTFLYNHIGLCMHSVPNDLDCTNPFFKGGGGRAFVLFEELAVLPHHIAFDLAIAPYDSLVFERGVIEDHIHTVFLRDSDLSINVGIKFDFSEQWQLANIG